MAAERGTVDTRQRNGMAGHAKQAVGYVGIENSSICVDGSSQQMLFGGTWRLNTRMLHQQRAGLPPQGFDHRHLGSVGVVVERQLAGGQRCPLGMVDQALREWVRHPVDVGFFTPAWQFVTPQGNRGRVAGCEQRHINLMWVQIDLCIQQRTGHAVHRIGRGTAGQLVRKIR